MLPWQQRVRAVLALLIVLLGVAIAIVVRARRGGEPDDAPPPRIDPKAISEVQGRGDITHTKDGRVVFTVRFDQQLSYPDGRTVWQGVTVRFPDREGRTFLLTAREARQLAKPGSRLGEVSFEGRVRMTGNDGLEVNTDSASYDESSGVVRAPGRVTFARGRVSGSGLGATYDQFRDTLWLLDEAHVVVAADATGQGAMTIDSGAAGLARRDRYVRFERGATMTGSTQSARAETATVFLAAADDRLDRLELSGDAHVTGAPEGGSGLQAMRARHIALDYAEDGRTLQRASLKDAASVDLAAAGGTRTLSGGAIDAALGPGGQAVTSLAASTDVVLVLPAEASAPARRIRSATLAGRGDPQGIRTLLFGGGVEYRESRSEAGAVDRTATADTLEVGVKPGFGAAESAHFMGRVTFRDGAVRGDAPDARYALEKAVIRLSPGEGAPAAPAPRVVDDRVSIDARAIDLAVGAKRLTADGDVRSVLQPAKDAASPSGRQTPVMLKRDEPVNVTAAGLAYDSDAGRAIYTGGARLWQGETSIQGDRLELDDKAGNLVVEGHAVSRLFLEAKGREKEAKKTETLARGDHLLYDNAARKATYEGHAQVQGPQGDVSADRIELFLDESGRALERAEGYTNVTARFEGGQRATGGRLTYLADGERYTMTGAPARVLEKVSDGCSETFGATLTFVRSTDTISVVGTEGSRSQTKPGSCAELR